MELNDLEKKFFREVLDAELDIPVRATMKLEDGQEPHEIIVIPRIDPDGFFILEYFDAPPYAGKEKIGSDGNPYREWIDGEIFGVNPLLLKAQANHSLIPIRLHPSTSIPAIAQKVSVRQILDTEILHAGMKNRGNLRLRKNQIVGSSPLRNVKFSLVNFLDFVLTERAQHNLAIHLKCKTEIEALKSAVRKVTGIDMYPFPPLPFRITLQNVDGWKITLTRENERTRNSVSHTGLIEKIGDEDFSVDELNDVLEGLKYFFAFAAGVYCHPTAAIGYDASKRPAWGQIGRFDLQRSSWSNWFKNSSSATDGGFLEDFFPKFWVKWKENRTDFVRIVEGYVESDSIRRNGTLQDAMMRSYLSLEILLDMMLQDESQGSNFSRKDELLSQSQIPHHILKQSKNTLILSLAQKLKSKPSTGYCLLREIRNVVSHPMKEKTARKYLSDDPIIYVYLFDLSQFYLEYMLLKFCDYQHEPYRQLVPH